MTPWSAPKRPAAYAEESLVTAILDGTYPPGGTLPSERDLAAQLGVTRPTLREALQRLEREGWLAIEQGKPTRVTDYWHEGGLTLLSTLVRYSPKLPSAFVPNLLEVRLALAPAYARAAVACSPGAVLEYLAGCAGLDDTPEAYAAFDWGLHYALTVASGNPIYTLILNGFAGFYEEMARRYFVPSEARDASRRFYAALETAARQEDADQAQQVTQAMMADSIELWRQAQRLSLLSVPDATSHALQTVGGSRKA